MHRIIINIFILVTVLAVNPVLAAPVLVEPEWLDKKLGKEGLVLIDMSSEDTQYERFHIPGAYYLPYQVLIKMDKKKGFPEAVSDLRMNKILGYFGISENSQVVIYDDMGGLNAGRLFWQLERMGHKQVSVLNGGLVKWILSGRKVTNEITSPVPVKHLLKDTVTKRENHADIEDVRAAIKDPSTVILDVRSDVEYLGDSKKKKGGHVPGARWWPWQQGVDFENGFARADKKKIEQLLQKAGVSNKQKPVIVYCRSGHRASQAYLTLRSLGYKNVKLYANSMNEYGRSGSKLVQGKNP
ncbi:MAG: sulfurtransferase [Acidiferrobacterales bacterium]